MPLTPCRIPTEPLLPILREYLDKYETSAVPTAAYAGAPLEEYRGGHWLPAPSALQILAREAEVGVDFLQSLRSGRTKTVEFDAADRLLCAMGQVHLWWGPLKDVYYGVKFVDELPTPVERQRARRHELRAELDRVRAEAIAA